MRIKLNDEQMRAVDNENDLIVDGEVWEYINALGVEEDEHGKSYTYIFKRPSDGKHFMITIFHCRYGHKDYGYEDYMQCKEANEVERMEIVRYDWVIVK